MKKNAPSAGFGTGSSPDARKRPDFLGRRGWKLAATATKLSPALFDPMKWLFVLFLAIIIFGGAAWFGYNFVFKEDIQVRKEQRGEVTSEPRIDLTLPEYEEAAKLRQEGKIPEARAALTAFIQKYPTSPHAEGAQDLLGEVNVDILL